MTRFSLVILMCSSLFCAPLSAANAAIDAAGAETVKKMVKGMFDTQIEDIKSQAGKDIKIKMSGDYVVEPKGTYYAVKSPHMIFQILIPEFKSLNATPGFEIDYGVTNLNVMPGAIPTQWRMAVAVPSPIIFKSVMDVDCGSDKKCKKEKGLLKNTSVELHQKTQKFQILWDDTQKMILKQDGLVDGINIKYDGKPVPFTIGSVAWASAATETTPGIYDTRSNSSFKNMILDFTGANCSAPCTTSGKGTIGEIFMTGTSSGYDHKLTRALTQKMAEIMDAGYDDTKLPTPEAFAALWKEVMAGMNSFDKADGTFGVRDVSVSITEKSSPTPINFGVKEFLYGGGISNWKSDKSNIYLLSKMDGLTLPENIPVPMYKVFVPYLPLAGNERYDIQNIPHKKLFEQLGAMGQNLMGAIQPKKCDPKDKTGACDQGNLNAQQAEMMGMQAMMTLPKLFADAGTKVTLHSDATAPKMTLLMDGDFTASATAMYSGVGKFKAVLGGIDAMITDLQTVAKDPTTPPSDAQTYNMILGMLTGFQMFGQQGTDTKGNPARIYDLTLDDKGAIKLNGADLSTFKDMGGPTVPPAPAGKP